MSILDRDGNCSYATGLQSPREAMQHTPGKAWEARKSKDLRPGGTCFPPPMNFSFSLEQLRFVTGVCLLRGGQLCETVGVRAGRPSSPCLLGKGIQHLSMGKCHIFAKNVFLPQHIQALSRDHPRGTFSRLIWLFSPSISTPKGRRAPSPSSSLSSA